MHTIELKPEHHFTDRKIILDKDEKLLSWKDTFRFNEPFQYIIQTKNYIYCDKCDIFGTDEEKKKYAEGCPFHTQK